MPTIALACILKNEERNLKRFLESVKGCFDEIHLTDTGSTDRSIEIINELKDEYNIKLHHFKWIDDFSAARNASFEPVKTDYVMWMDLDDVMSDREAFINFRNTMMKFCDFWVATYHYASDASGRPVCSFVRERIVKTDLRLKWKYFVHEGIVPKREDGSPIMAQYATSWAIIHKRDDEDAKQDRSRNLRLFENRKDSLDSRMRYYYGKELFENQKPLEAFPELKKAAEDSGLEGHDRIMAIQYACLASMALGQFTTAISLAHAGLQLDPGRAEFYIIIGDSYLKANQHEPQKAIPFFTAATGCNHVENRLVFGAIFTHEESYKHYPLNQLARIYANMGQLEKADEYLNRANAFGPHAETLSIINDIKILRDKAGLNTQYPRAKTEDIVISCHPQGFYEWDEQIYREKGIGGSETAAVEMAYWLSKLSKRRVIVFNNKKTGTKFNDVSYRPAEELPVYFSRHEPKVNINWRHNIKLTNAPTYLWCHDLIAPGIENHQNYKEVLALSQFHKDFLINLAGVPANKIRITRNGIDPNRFKILPDKEGNRVIWSSSPDRGIERAIRVMDVVVKEVPDAELHCYYGFDNMLKMGKSSHVESIQRMISERPYIKFHGNIPQKELTLEMAKSKVWLYPTSFQETFCITALEALCCKTYPVTRNYGALENTLDGHQAARLTIDCEKPADVELYGKTVIDALRLDSWKLIDEDPSAFSWESVAKEWIEFMGL